MITVYARGARKLVDARPLVYGGTHVHVTFSGETAQLHIGGRIVAERPATDVQSAWAAQDWAYEVIDTANELSAPAAEETQAVPGVSVADYNEAVHGPAAKQVRDEAAATLAEADRQDALAAKVAARPTLADEYNPHHPKHKAARIQAWADHLRKDAEILAAWTAGDEAGYQRYVSDGLADTDGYYAPEDRTMWKRHNSR